MIRSLALTFCFIALTIAEQSPVFLWGAHSVDKPSLPVVSSKEFAELMTPLLEKKCLVVIMEKGLSNKDLLCTNENGKSCYARLQGVNDKTYYAAVDNPIEALRTIGGEHYYSSVDNNDEISKHLEAGKIIFLNFEDENQYPERELILQRHDSKIASTTSRLGDKCFFVYTSSPSTSSLKRHRRQVPQHSTDGYVFRYKNNFLIYYDSLSVTIDNDPPTALEMNGFDFKSDNSTTMSVTFTSTTGSHLTFDITLAGGYFFMQNVMYNNIKLLSSNVYAPTNFSYFCGNLTLNNIPTEKDPARYTLKWNYLQFQAPFGSTQNESFVFGDAWHCVGFFTGSILSGLLIVALLLTITFIGVCWMMDINTMDRFDDPKGKTITINATD